MALEPWQQTMRDLPFVCPKCSRRFPRLPFKGRCPNHTSVVKVTDQTPAYTDPDDSVADL